MFRDGDCYCNSPAIGEVAFQDNSLLLSDGAIPVNTGRLFVFVSFIQPVIIRQVLFSVASSFCRWVERCHTV